MEQWLQQLLTDYQAYALLILFLLTFAESVAVLGLLVPGTALMFSFGVLIGAEQMEFWTACLIAAVAGLVGDSLSYLAGRQFRPQLEGWNWLSRQQKELNKISGALENNVWLAIVAGRFIGPSRPLLPLLAGMLKLPPSRYFPAATLACILWPVVYFLPGILAGVAWQLKGTNLTLFYSLLAASVLLAVVSSYLLKKYLQHKEQDQPKRHWFWGSLVSIFLTAFLFFELSQHPATPLYLKELSGLMF
ncbi:DedA family protein [Rheinheimera sp. A13L]|uniref:DedA family protein n=1 Tax=Rheinheimera sp. A13L TaxID=506534 RepID=UPI00058FE9EB|nr:DedA family protein [Rheinheimera sp. A13L]